ncbi:hypothetical protein GCK72_017140 [Caenorhabditis remanei]|uniref:Uncharacterized protein n=1 Tax=Caenorhabditis remanei TaxID=31234 RepID=A0A6A5G7X2_CAERE|nr:hypothetical protein GCK72_017140 [Caenorhabditis remanei]KAF1750589.1 hypothetical protein GCK72_017140 [Caenorhabditis remanei]
MKILIPPKKEQPNLISTLFEEFLLDDSRKRSQQQVVSFSKLLIEQSGKLREDSKPTEEESLQLENLRNTLNNQWKEQSDLIAENKVYVCYAKISLLIILTLVSVCYTMGFLHILNVNDIWYPIVIIIEILMSLVVLYRLLKLRQRIITESQSDVELGTEKQIVLETMKLSYTEQLERCVDFYSKEVMPLKEEAKALSNHAYLWGILCFSIFILNVSIFQIFCVIEALKQFNKDLTLALQILANALQMLPGISFIAAIAFIFVVTFLRENAVAM